MNSADGLINLARHPKIERAQRLSAFTAAHRAVRKQLAAMQQQQASADASWWGLGNLWSYF